MYKGTPYRAHNQELQLKQKLTIYIYMCDWQSEKVIYNTKVIIDQFQKCSCIGGTKLATTENKILYVQV